MDAALAEPAGAAAPGSSSIDYELRVVSLPWSSTTNILLAAIREDSRRRDAENAETLRR
jgi:hypothetical protein